MSLVSTYVKAVDGKFYKNPVLSGPNWFVCFDDDDPPELVIATRLNLPPERILNDAGIKYSKLRKQGKSGRVFGGKIKNACAYFFDLDSALPVPNRHDGAFDKLTGDRVTYDFKEPS